MNYKITTYPPFDKAVKRLNKRYASLKQDLTKLVTELQNNPQLGIDLGNGFRKIRMAISSKGKGKSGGARVITLSVLVSQNDAIVALVYIYDKSERENISPKEIDALLIANGFIAQP